MDAETLCHLHFADVWVLPPLWISSVEFSFAFWRLLLTKPAAAMYILNRQSTLLPAGQPRRSQFTHVVHQVLRGERCLCATGRGWKIFDDSQRTHPLTSAYFSQSRKESIKSMIWYRKIYSDSLLPSAKIICVLGSGIEN